MASLIQQERNLQWFVSSNMFSMLCSVVILANAVFVGVHTEYSLRNVLEGGKPLNWVVADAVFCVWFAFELSLRVIASPHTFCCGRDWKWNHFDVLLVLNYIIDVVLQAHGGSSAGSSFATIRILRAFRMTRILRLIRVMRFFRSLRLMVYSIIHSLVSLLWVFLLLVFAMYVFAIYFLNVVSDAFQSTETVDATVLSQLRTKFSSVMDALLTLFMSIAGGIDWQAIIQPLIELHWVYGVVFFIYVFFVVFGVLNVVTGAFVDSMRLVSQRDVDVVIDDAMKKETEYKDDVKRIFVEADTDMSGTLSWEEFEEHLQDSRVKAYLTSLGLDVKHAKAMFMLLDVDECNAVEINEFVDGCMRLKGGATSIDVNMLLYENEKLLCKVDSYSRFAREKFARLEAVLGIPPEDGAQSQQRLSRPNKEARGHVTNRLDHAADIIKNLELGESEPPRATAACSASAFCCGVSGGSMDSSARSSLVSDGLGVNVKAERHSEGVGHFSKIA